MARITPYRGDLKYIFVSYAHKDMAQVKPILKKLQDDGYRLWFDEGIDPGSEWDDTIAEHICDCGYFLALMSNNYIASSNCKDELNYARDLEKKRLIVYLEQVELPRGLAMRVNRIQSLFKYRYSEDNDFYEALYYADGLEEFCEGREPCEGSAEKVSEMLETKNPKSNEEENKTELAHYLTEILEIKNEQTDVPLKTEEEEADVVQTAKPEYAVLDFEDGARYEGEALNGKPHGNGKYTNADGIIYEGEFFEGLLHGQGICRMPDESYYEGSYSHGKMVGLGKMHQFILTDGSVYDGETLDGKPHGQGKRVYINGSEYMGGFENGKMHGFGKVVYNDGSSREGERINGVLNGDCIEIEPNGEKSVSCYRFGKKI